MTPYYSDDAVTIYHGDCREVLPTLAARAFGLCLTDPPYGVGVRYGAGFDDGRGDYWLWLKEIVVEMRRVASVVAFTHKVDALKQITDWDWAGVWSKELSTGVRLGNSPFVPHWEPILLYGIHTLGTQTTFSPDVFSARPIRVSGQASKGRVGWKTNDVAEHPTPKPEMLWRKLLEVLGQGGGALLDPFVGSGTTLRLAKDAGRKAVGIEIEERHCEIAAKRCAQEVLDFGSAA